MALDKRQREKREIKYANAKEIAEKQQRGFTPASITLPKGVKLFSFREEKTYRLSVIPFEAKKGNPNTDAGFHTYERTYYTHSGIGLEPRAHYCCSRLTFNEPCPVCEHVQQLQAQGASQDTIQALRPKRRQLIQWLDLQDRDKGIQVYEGSYFKGVGELLDAKLDAADSDSPMQGFFRADGGMVLHVRAKKQSFKGRDGAGSFIGPTNIEMEPRPKGVDDELLDQAICLDDLPRRMTYDELSKILHQTTGGEKEEERADRNGEDEERPALKIGDVVEHAEFGRCEVAKVSPDGSSVGLRDSEGKPHRGVDPRDCELVEPDQGGDEEDVEEEESDEEGGDDDFDDEEDDFADEPPAAKDGRSPGRRGPR